MARLPAPAHCALQAGPSLLQSRSATPPPPEEGTGRPQSSLTWDRPHGWHHGHGCRHHGWLVAGHLHHPWVHWRDRVLPRQCPPRPSDSLPPADTRGRPPPARRPHPRAGTRTLHLPGLRQPRPAPGRGEGTGSPRPCLPTSRLWKWRPFHMLPSGPENATACRSAEHFYLLNHSFSITSQFQTFEIFLGQAKCKMLLYDLIPRDSIPILQIGN